MDVAVIDVLAKDRPHVPFAGDQHPVQALAAGAGNPSFSDRVRPGAHTGVLTIRTPAAANTASNAAVNLAYRSRMRNWRPGGRRDELIAGPSAGVPDLVGSGGGATA